MSFLPLEIDKALRRAEEYWRRNGYEWVTAIIPGLTPPPYYSFLKRRDQAFGPFPAK